MWIAYRERLTARASSWVGGQASCSLPSNTTALQGRDITRGGEGGGGGRLRVGGQDAGRHSGTPLALRITLDELLPVLGFRDEQLSALPSKDMLSPQPLS